LECSKFLLDRVIVLYIYEVFPRLENSGVDVFGGWEAIEMDEDNILMDVTNPLVVARYWLIRWMISIASDRFQATNSRMKAN
jgi:hypothetical protein